MNTLRVHLNIAENWELKNTVAKYFLNVWIVPWDPFLMKKLLKSEIYGSVNSARCVLIGWEEREKSNFVATVYVQCMNNCHKSHKRVQKNKNKNKNKKKKENFPSNPNIALVFCFMQYIYIWKDVEMHMHVHVKNYIETLVSTTFPFVFSYKTPVSLSLRQTLRKFLCPN